MTDRYLITGAQGFAGRCMVEMALSTSEAVVLGIGRSDDRRLFDDGRRYEYFAVDIRDKRRLGDVIRDFRPTVVFHLASGLRDDMPDELFGTNVLGTVSLIEAIADSGVSATRVVIASSGGVYGRLVTAPLAEDAACVPADIYSASKLAQENVAMITGRAVGLDIVIARLFNLVGAGQDERHACARFAQQLVARARNADATPVETGDLTTTRDFIDVRDVAAALLILSRRGQTGQIYNVASGVETSIEELFRLTCDAVGFVRHPRVLQTYHRATDVPRHVADIAKVRAIGFRTRYDLAESVRDLVCHYRTAA
jgi:nucleoside-diphosphate-sugar epimerase